MMLNSKCRVGLVGSVVLMLIAGLFGTTASAGTRPADVVIAVTSLGQARAGQSAQFDVTVSNAGGVTASSDVTVSFSPQGGVGGPVSAAGNDWACTPSSCTTTSDIPPSSTLPPIHVGVPVVADRTNTSLSEGRIVLAVNVAVNDDAAANDNGASASTGIQAAGLADAALTLRPPAVAPTRGQSADFTAIVANVGAAAIQSRVELVFSTALSGHGSGWTCPAGSGRCVTDADVAPGAALPQLTLRSQTSVSSSATTESVSASIETTDDFASQNNAGSAQTALVPAIGPDLTVTARPGPVVTEGSTATALISVTNMGTAQSTGDIELTYGTGASASGAGWTCPAGAGRCVTSATVAPGGSLPNIEVRNTTNVSSSSTTFSAQVSGGGDGLVLNNYGTIAVPLSRTTAPVDILATIASHYDPATRIVIWTIEAANAGSAPATATTLVTFQLPNASAIFGGNRSLSDYTVGGTGWICAAQHCVHQGPIAPGAKLPNLVLEAPLPAFMGASDISFSASIQSASDDYIENGSVGGSIEIGGIGADLATTVSAGGSVRVGDSGAASVKVSNLGNAVATGPVEVSVDNSVPGTAVSGAGWLCGPDLVCTHPGPVPSGTALPELQVLGPSTNRSVGTRVVSASLANESDQVPNDNGGGSSYGVGGVTADLLPVLDVDGPWISGDLGRATATVANAGPAPSSGPVTLQIDASTGTVPRGDGWICTRALACTYAAPIPAGAAAPQIELLWPVPASLPATTAGITATLLGADDDYPFNDQVAAGVAVAATSSPGRLQAEFARDISGNVTPGQSEHVTLSIRNSASTDAPGPFSVRLTPSQAITVEDVEGTGWTCDATLLCRRTLSILAGDSAPLDLTIRASTAATSLESLLASARQGTSAAATALLPLPLATVSGVDLLQEVEATDATPTGSIAQFRVRVRNGGAVVARKRVQVRLTAIGRSGGSVTGSGSGWTCPPGTERCVTDADVPPGGTLSDLVVLAPTVSGDPGGSIALQSNLEGVDDDAYPANDYGQARSPIVAHSGVDYVPSVAIEPDLEAGRPATGTIVVRNLGSAAGMGQVSVRYSASGSVAGTPRLSGSGWVCSSSRCLHPGPVPAGGALPPLALTTDTIQDRSASSSFGGLTVSATVDSDEDAVDSNDGTFNRAPIFAYSGVDLVYGLRPQTPLQDSATRRNIPGTVRNVGEETATERIEVTLPSSWSAAGPGWTCPASWQVRHRRRPGPGQRPAWHIDLRSRYSQSHPRHGGRRAASHRLRTASPATTTRARPSRPNRRPSPDLVALLTPPFAASAGDPVQFDAVIRNPGGAPSSGTVTVSLRPDTATGSGSGWSCSGTTCLTNAVVPTDGTLPPLSVSRPTDPDASSADVAVTVSAEPDSSAVNDEAAATVGLVRPPAGADLRLRGTLTSGARQGGPASWSVVAANDGDAASTEVTVYLQPLYLYTGVNTHALASTASGAGWTCETSTSCTHAPLAAGQASAPIILKYAIPTADALGVLDLGASVSGGRNQRPLTTGSVFATASAGSCATSSRRSPPRRASRWTRPSPRSPRSATSAAIRSTGRWS